MELLVLHTNSWCHFIVLKRNINVRQYLKPFNYVQTIQISVSKHNKITNKLFADKSYMYNYLTVCK